MDSVSRSHYRLPMQMGNSFDILSPSTTWRGKRRCLRHGDTLARSSVQWCGFRAGSSTCAAPAHPICEMAGVLEVSVADFPSAYGLGIIRISVFMIHIYFFFFFVAISGVRRGRFSLIPAASNRSPDRWSKRPRVGRVGSEKVTRSRLAGYAHSHSASQSGRIQMLMDDASFFVVYRWGLGLRGWEFHGISVFPTPRQA
jgi:hypothetical protein